MTAMATPISIGRGVAAKGVGRVGRRVVTGVGRELSCHDCDQHRRVSIGAAIGLSLDLATLK